MAILRDFNCSTRIPGNLLATVLTPQPPSGSILPLARHLASGSVIAKSEKTMTRQGTAFEIQVKERLEWELQRNELGILPEYARVYHQKAYFSASRNKPIVMDVVIEIYRPVASTPYLVWVWECKDYGHRVPVDDVEEFHAKLEQIGLHKSKGTIICRNGFQEGAITYAKSVGIGLARMLPIGAIKRLQEAVRNTRISWEFVMQGLMQDTTRPFEANFYGLLSSGRGVTTLSDMFSGEISNL